MSLRSKKKNQAATGSLQDGGNRPFTELDRLVQQAGIKLKREEEPKPVLSTALPGTESDNDIFERAMEDVTPSNWVLNATPSSQPSTVFDQKPGTEDLRLMQAALEGNPPPAISDHPEYIEGWVGVDGKLFLPKLRDGLYSIQEQIDLHGLSRAEAQQAVEEFIERMSRFRSCCVKIIHGRGINSPNDRSTLKESLQRWLSTRRMARHVVAYASAPGKDGGVGAIYLLLRHRRTSR